MALKGAIGDLNKTTNFFSLSLFQLSLSLILTSRVAVSTTSEARDVAAPRESASSRAAKSEERSRMVAFFFFYDSKTGEKTSGQVLRTTFSFPFAFKAPSLFFNNNKKTATCPLSSRPPRRPPSPPERARRSR